MSAITYNRFQYYSKLRTYALDDSALVSTVRVFSSCAGGTAWQTALIVSAATTLISSGTVAKYPDYSKPERTNTA